MSSEAVDYSYLPEGEAAIGRYRRRDRQQVGEPDRERNHGRLVVIRPETPASVLAQRNVIHTEDERRRLGKAIDTVVQRERASTTDLEERIASLEALDAATPPYDFEK